MSVVRHSWDFVKGVSPALGFAVAAISDPLQAAHALGLMTNTEWIIEPWARQAIFAACAFGWLWLWYLRVRHSTEPRSREPDMPLHHALRWIARDSGWASAYSWPDEQWPIRVQAELLSRWQLGRFEMMGQDRHGNNGLTYLPPAMKGTADFRADMLTTTEPPTHIWSKEHRAKDGSPTCFYEVKLDRREVMLVWPRRSFLDRMRRRSPIERLGGYEGIFTEQDRWYAKNYTLPGVPLEWILAQ